MDKLENWIKVIEESSGEDVEFNYDGIYDAHLKAQQVVGPDPVFFTTPEMNAWQHKHHKRRISNNRLKFLDENFDPDLDEQGSPNSGGDGAGPGRAGDDTPTPTPT